MGTEAVLVITALAAAAVRSSCSVVLAGLSQIHSNRSGVMNLAIDGMVAGGAFACFVAVHYTESLLLGVVSGIAVGGVLGLLLAFLLVDVGLDTNLTGVMLGLLIVALADFASRPLVGNPIESLRAVSLGWLSDLPVVGAALFSQNPLVYVTWLLVAVTWVIFRYLRLGSVICAAGDNPRAADAAGLNVRRTRFLSTLYGGMLAGLSGAYVMLNYSSVYVTLMTAGRGFIAMALVVFSGWDPVKLVLAGLAFGAIEALQFQLELLGVKIHYHLLLAMPYIATIIVVILTGRLGLQKRPVAPQALGKPYRRE